jgi:ribose 1,5-bisphosphokinase
MAVLVVGESGVGKDTLLEGAARGLRDDPGIVFVRRAVTRNPHGSEDFEPMTWAAFDAAHASGAFALAWHAHGLGYGIPVAADADISAGRSIVLNASRSVIPSARARYANLRVVLIVCSSAVRAERMAARGRESAADMSARLARTVATFDPGMADAIIDNSGPPAAGIIELTGLLRSFRSRVAP